MMCSPECGRGPGLSVCTDASCPVPFTLSSASEGSAGRCLSHRERQCTEAWVPLHVGHEAINLVLTRPGSLPHSKTGRVHTGFLLVQS